MRMSPLSTVTHLCLAPGGSCSERKSSVINVTEQSYIGVKEVRARIHSDKWIDTKSLVDRQTVSL